jgi:hypothetical protein
MKLASAFPFVLALLVASCAVFPSGESGDSASGGGGAGGSAPACAEGSACRVAADCSCLSGQAGECSYADCQKGACVVLSSPQGQACAVGEYPNRQCDGAGTCARIPPGPGCFGESGLGACPSCDDGNPCTVDSCGERGCEHRYEGIGTACGNGGTCREGGYCCGASEDVCDQEGAIGGDCAVGSVCLGGRCWISCAPPLQGACATTPWRSCAPLRIGDHVGMVCQ